MRNLPQTCITTHTQTQIYTHLHTQTHGNLDFSGRPHFSLLSARFLFHSKHKNTHTIINHIFLLAIPVFSIYQLIFFSVQTQINTHKNTNAHTETDLYTQKVPHTHENRKLYFSSRRHKFFPICHSNSRLFPNTYSHTQTHPHTHQHIALFFLAVTIFFIFISRIPSSFQRNTHTHHLHSQNYTHTHTPYFSSSRSIFPIYQPDTLLIPNKHRHTHTQTHTHIEI